jgi:2'-5' RNA ligase
LNPAKDPKYFIAILPPSPIYEEALEIKRHFETKYNSKGALKSPPHITLHMPFLWKEKKERLLIEKLNQFASASPSFQIEFGGFGSFPPRVIFINVASNSNLNELQRSLNRFCKTELQLFNSQYRDLPFHPHLTVAFRDLKKDKFAEAWSEFENKSFQRVFQCESITLLKHDGHEWIPLKHFQLSNHTTISNLV